MKLAWNQTFQPGLEALAPCLVIVWHSEWMSAHHELWNKLHKKLSSLKKPTRIFVILFGNTPDDLSEKRQGNPLESLLRALTEDAMPSVDCKAHFGGWATISDVLRFRSTSVTWRRTSRSSLLRLCKTCAKLCTYWNNGRRIELPVPNLSDFFQFLSDPASFRSRSLHDKPAEATQAMRVLKWLASHATIPRSIPLNILMIENRPGSLPTLRVVPKSNVNETLAAKDCRALSAVNDKIEADLGPLAFGTSPLRFPQGARVYLVSDGFDRLRFAEGREELKRAFDSPGQPFAWDEVDLVLQDIVLDDESKMADGLDLVPHYFEACPQAMVFVLTSLDIESLVGSGDVNWRYVDCIVSKSALATLWYEYRRCFRECFGRMFWPDWPLVEPNDRTLLRDLFGSLRKWRIEPDILWHGQNLPEMIDHANRHITALWRLTNDFIGTLIERGAANKEVLSLRRRIALAVAVWMHDVGHRGDEYLAGAMDVRASHAGISERLLLRNPDAYALGWLLNASNIPHEPCGSSNGGGRAARLECRNATKCSAAKESKLCLLREAGLLCRHHQSNAPLNDLSITRMATRGKAPSVYSLIPDTGPDPEIPRIETEQFLRAMTNDSLPMPSPSGTRVRSLEDFGLKNSTPFMCVAGLLRMLDALQLHRSRVGSAASINSFNEFLETRFLWCATERRRLEHALRAAMPGTRAFNRAMGDLDALGEYELLLTTQQAHYWRQAAVHDVQILWRWNDEGEALVDIAYTLNERALAGLTGIGNTLPTINGKGQRFGLEGALKASMTSDASASLHNHLAIVPIKRNVAEISIWIHNVTKEVVVQEHESQYGTGPVVASVGYLGVLADNVTFRVVVADTDRNAFDRKNPYVIHQSRK